MNIYCINIFKMNELYMLYDLLCLMKDSIIHFEIHKTACPMIEGVLDVIARQNNLEISYERIDMEIDPKDSFIKLKGE